MTMQLLLSQAATVLGCDVIDNDVMLNGAEIDSRQLKPGNLFVALKGDTVDGHDYIKAARLAGASAALVSSKQDDDLPQLVVADVKQAFGQIAAYWRTQCQAEIIAVTGSNGKTTVKEMLAAILSQYGSVIATKGNLNNDLGVPLTLCRLSVSTQYAVIEMGANHPGEIAYLVAMTQPKVSLINNVAAAHLAGFTSIEGVAAAKAEIFLGLADDGIGIINSDMSFASQWQQDLKNRQVVTFSLENQADITACDVQIDPQSSHFMVKLGDEFNFINLPLPGRHNIANALAAIAICKALNIPVAAIEKGLAQMASVPHRLQIRGGHNQSRLIDDSYNANPGSYAQALMTLSAFGGEHWLVLGDFGELGDDSQQHHCQMGIQAKVSGITRLWTVGDESQFASQAYGVGAMHFGNVDELKQQLKLALTSDVTCLIKGSRFMQLDKLADALSVAGED